MLNEEQYRKIIKKIILYVKKHNISCFSATAYARDLVKKYVIFADVFLIRDFCFFARAVWNCKYYLNNIRAVLVDNDLLIKRQKTLHSCLYHMSFDEKKHH